MEARSQRQGRMFRKYVFHSHPFVLKFLDSWLHSRSASVCVDGIFSDIFAFLNMVYQGTVFGPHLWNVFYADSRIPVQRNLCTEVVFADDLNCFKAFDATASDRQIYSGLASCQSDLHR